MNEDATATNAEVKRFLRQHFADFVADDPTVIERNISREYIDHDAESGRTIGLAEATKRAQSLRTRLREPHVDIRDILVEGDKAVIRAVWTATDAQTNERIEFHGFVLFRIGNGKIVERWATTTDPRAMAAPLIW